VFYGYLLPSVYSVSHCKRLQRGESENCKAEAMNSANNLSIAEPIIRPRMPELDTIRGIAVLSVFVFHGFEEIVWAPVARPLWQRLPLELSYQGWGGVNLFFVLSGFLITGILLDSRGKPRYYARFYTHRALRILPAYYLLLLVLFVLGRVGIIRGNDLGAFLGLSFIYLSNLAPLFGVYIYYWPLWSLAVEEHFYLIWPTVVRFVSTRGLGVIAGCICIIEPLLRFLALRAGREVWWAGPQRIGAFRYTWMYADGLALGALLAIFVRSAWGNRKALLKLAGITAAGALVATILSFVLPATLAVCLRGTLVNYAAPVMIAVFLLVGTGAHRSWANVRLLSFYGYISYGLYLIHGLVIEFYKAAAHTYAPSLLVGTDLGRCCLRFAVCLVIATAIAYASRVTFEEFFLRMKDGPAKARAAAA
jgi:peptidoglycan/LPS O-acetylase OafA/YrhL